MGGRFHRRRVYFPLTIEGRAVFTCVGYLDLLWLLEGSTEKMESLISSVTSY